MTNTLRPAEVFSPGEYLRDELAERGWTETEFAQIIGRPAQAISDIINGHKEITAETAVAFGAALGTSAALWLNLQTSFRLRTLEGQEQLTDPVERRARLRSLVPVNELSKRGWIPQTQDLTVLEPSICELLGIATPSEEPAFAAAARKAQQSREFTPQQNAWLGRVLQLASTRKTSSYDAAAFKDFASGFATRLRNPDDLRWVEAELAACGVLLVVLLPLKSSKLDGAALVTAKEVPIIALTTRGDRLDGFVFTLLHEAAHLLLGHVGSSGPCVDEERNSETTDNNDRAADEQAFKWMFPNGFIPPAQPISTAKVITAAKSYDVHPSLIIGQLHKRGLLDWSRLGGSIPKVRPYISVSD